MACITFGLIAHPADPAFLLLPAEGNWTLPSAAFMEDQSIEGRAGAAFSQLLDCPITILRQTRRPQKSESGVNHRFYDLEAHAALQIPSGARWVSREELDPLSLAPPEQRAPLERAFEERLSEQIPPQRSPWALLGWHEQAVQWITDRLHQQAVTITGPIEQFYLWNITSVLKAPTTGGDYYFKAAHPMFPHEARLSLTLSEEYPGRVPHVVAADFERNWFLMKGFEGKKLGEVEEDPKAWEQAARLFAQIQVESVERVEEYLALGCLDRRLPRFPALLDELLNDEASLRTDPEVDLPGEWMELLRGFQPQFLERVRELDEFQIPPSLLHGDLHPFNIVLAEEGPLIFDWSDSAIGPPFFDLLTDRNDVSRLPDLVNVYLEPWIAFAPMDRLKAAFDLSQKLLPFYHVMSYRHINLRAEPDAQWELCGGATYFLKRLLIVNGLLEEEPEKPAE
jgi:hypothetical protein